MPKVKTIKRPVWFKIFKYLMKYCETDDIGWVNAFQLIWMKQECRSRKNKGDGINLYAQILDMPKKSTLNKFKKDCPTLVSIFNNLEDGWAFPGMLVKDGDWIREDITGLYGGNVNGSDCLFDVQTNPTYDILEIRRGDKIIFKE